MATASRHASGPHGSGASLEELQGWRAFVHLARELKLARLARLAYPYRARAIFSLVAMIVVTLSSLAVPYLHQDRHRRRHRQEGHAPCSPG